MRYFTPTEFRDSWPVMSQKLLALLDEFRERWGAPVIISPAPGALARYLGPESTSQHNVDKWGECRAADIMPVGMDSATERHRAFEIAKDVGFTGIGVSPIWRPRAGLHLDVRQGRERGDPAKWGYAREDGRQVIVPVNQVLFGVAKIPHEGVIS